MMKCSLTMTPLEIDIWTDLSCPWCFISTRRLATAAATFAQAHPGLPPLQVTYRSFQVAPDLPDSYAGTVAESWSSTRDVRPNTLRRSCRA